MSRRHRHEVVWVRSGRLGPGQPVPESFDVAAVAEVAEPSFPLDLEAAIRQSGLPGFPDLDPQGELKELLLAAAEVEHGLMAQYLFVVNSCTDNSLASPIRQIAIEEMGHLVTVQNLLLAADGAPYLGRYDRSPNEFDPFPFHLQPVSSQVIAKYAACEMPAVEDVDPGVLDILPDLRADAMASAGNMEPHRIGLLYAKIYWLLRDTDQPLPDPSQEPWPDYPVTQMAAMFPGRHVGTFPIDATLPSQARAEDWRPGHESVIVQTIESRPDALRAVVQISAQGEGFAGETDGHFDRFVRAYRAARTAGSIARPFATDPWFAGSSAPRGAPEAQVTSPTAIDFARLGDLLYEILLIAITLALHPDSGFGEPQRSTVAGFCIAVMREALGPYARALPRLRIGEAADSPQLSLCLSLPDVPEDPQEMHPQLDHRLTQALALASTLEGRADLHVSLRSAARTVRELLETRRGDLVIPQVP